MDETQILKIADVLQSTFEWKLTDMVSAIVSNVLGDVNTKVSPLQHENDALNDKVVQLERRIDLLAKQDDANNQYNRQNCLRVSGIKEEPGEQMDSIANRLSTEMKVDIDLKDIDNMHRLGRQISETSSTGPSTANMQLNSRPMDILIKFTTYRARQAVFSHRAELKHAKIFERVFINEELTKTRGEVYNNARYLVKNKRIQSAWTANGVILVKDNSNIVHMCESMSQLSKFN